MRLFDELNQKLSIIEDAVLEEVRTANLEKHSDGTWRFKLSSSKPRQRLLNTWASLRKQYSDLTAIKLSDSVINAMNQVELAVNFDLYHDGGEQTRWRVIFKYEAAFRILRELIVDLSRKHDAISAFMESHKHEFDEFRTTFDRRWNVFVAINYDTSDEVKLIHSILASLEQEHTPVLKFHFADDRRWLTELYSNLMFYMIACHAGLIFLTKSNTLKKGVLHNPNVAFEFGFMSGLGKKCELIRQDSVAAFTDVRGLLNSQYADAFQTRELVQKFLREQLLLSSR